MFLESYGEFPADIKNDKTIVVELQSLDAIDSLDVSDELATNNLYMRMYDVELVLRFFSMRHINEFSGQLSEFLDKCLICGNSLLDNNENREKILGDLFLDTINKAE